MSITSYDLRVQNRRIDALVKNLGKDSPLVENEINKIMQSIPDSSLKYVNGIPHIINPKKLNDAGYLKSELPNLRVWGKIKQDYSAGYKDLKKESEKSGESSNIYDIREYINMQYSIEDAVYKFGISDSKEPQAIKAVEILKKSHKSWNDIIKVNDILNGVDADEKNNS